MRQLLEVLRACHEVGLAVNLDQHADAAARVDVAFDEALACFTVGALGCCRNALLAKVDDGFLDVAVAGFEGALAVHYAGAGQFAQLTDLVWSNWHLSPL